jgi:uncharacterized iron-regulated protein
VKKFLLLLSVCATAFLVSTGSALAEDPKEDAGRCSMWVDMCRAEPIPYEAMLNDLASVRVIFIGERHDSVRHHEIQRRIIADLAKRGVKLVVGMEQLEAVYQPKIDLYNKGEIDFDQLAEQTDWSKRWGGYELYKGIVETANKAGAPVLGLNARKETIRQVARSGGLDKICPGARKELPAEVFLNDPRYEKLLNLRMQVHMAATPERLRPMIEAQMCRDAMMASVLCEFLKSEQGKDRTAIVICGSGHCSYGLGTATRVQRRLPGVTQRIVSISDSGDGKKPSPATMAMVRRISVTHEQLRAINRPIADYLHVTSRKPVGGGE